MEELESLKKILDGGFITKEEYDIRRTQIVDNATKTKASDKKKQNPAKNNDESDNFDEESVRPGLFKGESVILKKKVIPPPKQRRNTTTIKTMDERIRSSTVVSETFGDYCILHREMETKRSTPQPEYASLQFADASETRRLLSPEDNIKSMFLSTRSPRSSLMIPKISKGSVAFEKGDEDIEIVAYEYSRSTLSEYLVSPNNIKALEPTVPNWANVRWIDVKGFNYDTLVQLAKKFKLHPLAIGDCIHTEQRPKMKVYPNHLFVVTHHVAYDAKNDILSKEHVCMFINNNTVITIQAGEVSAHWDAVLKSLRKENSKIRNNDVEFLVYSLMDALSSAWVPITNSYGDMLEDLELELNQNPRNHKKLAAVRRIIRDLLIMQKLVKPLSTVIESMVSPYKWSDDLEDTEDDDLIAYSTTTAYHFSQETRTYLRYVGDNVTRVKDVLDTYKEVCASLNDLHQGSEEQRMNRLMYILAMVSSVFLPLTFFAGVYGMNFTNMPELNWQYGYAYWWGTALFMVMMTMMFLGALVRKS